MGAEAERRQVTVMFCDLVGSTALSARLDPEDLREVIGRYHACVARMVSRYDGFVAKYMGDGVLVYFGYPQAHEDDAEQAVRAGLALLSAVRELEAPGPLQLRIGIATGLGSAFRRRSPVPVPSRRRSDRRPQPRSRIARVAAEPRSRGTDIAAWLRGLGLE